MRIYLNLFFLALLLTACKGSDVPAGIIPRDQMIGLLVDVHLTDGQMYNIVQVPDSIYKYGMKRYLKVFKNHHTDTTQFRKSIEYYGSQPKMLDEMYDEVVQRLQAKNDSLQKVKK